MLTPLESVCQVHSMNHRLTALAFRTTHREPIRRSALPPFSGTNSGTTGYLIPPAPESVGRIALAKGWCLTAEYSILRGGEPYDLYEAIRLPAFLPGPDGTCSTLLRSVSPRFAVTHSSSPPSAAPQVRRR